MAQPPPGYPGYPSSGMPPVGSAPTEEKGILGDVMQGIGGQQYSSGQYGGQYPPPQSYYVPPGGYPAAGYGVGNYSHPTPQNYPPPQSSHGLGGGLATAALGALGGAALGSVLVGHHHHGGGYGGYGYGGFNGKGKNMGYGYGGGWGHKGHKFK
ncbi:g2659 [Coccomyxa elongata]